MIYLKYSYGYLIFYVAFFVVVTTKKWKEISKTFASIVAQLSANLFPSRSCSPTVFLSFVHMLLWFFMNLGNKVLIRVVQSSTTFLM